MLQQQMLNSPPLSTAVSYHAVVRNAYLSQETIETGICGILRLKYIKSGRSCSDNGIRFNSSLLPPYLKRIKTSKVATTMAVPARHLRRRFSRSS
ncbi:MAG: hypothetical protein ACTS73_05185 [Arsenophonus sp. NEOnobi-MAG3]